MECLYFSARFYPQFVSKSEIKDYPLYGKVVKMSGAIFVDRQHKDTTTIDALKQRMNDFEQGKCEFPIGIYPEGTCSNGDVLIDFQ